MRSLPGWAATIGSQTPTSRCCPCSPTLTGARVLALDLRSEKADHVIEAARTAYVGATRARSKLVVVGDPDVVEAYGFEELAGQLRETTA